VFEVDQTPAVLDQEAVSGARITMTSHSRHRPSGLPVSQVLLHPCGSTWAEDGPYSLEQSSKAALERDRQRYGIVVDDRGVM
jgi:hypothetical protein